MRSLHPPHRSSARLPTALAAALLLAACDREITREDAAAGVPSLVRARSVERITDLTLVAMNERGDIAYEEGARWTKEGRLESLPMPGYEGDARGINAAGVIVGSVQGSTGSYAVTWGRDRQIQVLPHPPAWADPNSGRMAATAGAINDAGVVAGNAAVDGQSRTFRWTPGGTMQLLPLTGWGADYHVETVAGINAAGDVLVSYEEGSYEQDCWDGWQEGPCEVEEYSYGAAVIKATGELVPLQFRSEASLSARDINDAGMVVGCNGGYAVVWSATGVQRTIAEDGCATAVNNAGVVVGHHAGGAFRWSQADGMQALGAPVGSGGAANDINEAGDITGWTRTASGAELAFLWTPDGGMQLLASVPDATRSEGLLLNEAREVAGISGGYPYSTRWAEVPAHPPFAHAGGPYPTRISGRRYTYSAAGSTEAPGSPAYYTWDMNGDGASDGWSAGAQTFSYAYPSAGTYTLRLVMWDAGESDTATAPVTVVANVAPVVSLGGVPTSIAEGALLAPVATVHDANQAQDSTELPAMRYRWEWGDGSVSVYPSSGHRYADQGSYTFRLIVTDGGGLADTVVRTIPVGNVPPTAKLTSPTSIGEGVPFTLTASALSDAAADVAAGLQVAFNCGGGFGAYGTALTIVCPARADQGSVTVGMRVRDKDAGGSGTTRTIPVGNVAPRVTAEATSPTTFSAGGTLSVRAAFTDVPADAPWRYRIYWGDGAYTVLTNVAAGATITGSHAYARPGSYQPYVAVVDKDGGSGRSAPIAVTVTP